jgi:hypothetical protein
MDAFQQFEEAFSAISNDEVSVDVHSVPTTPYLVDQDTPEAAAESRPCIFIYK